MNPETRNCQSCKQSFIIEPDDFAFYEKVNVDAPRMCPSCRAQRRLAFRNERVFYKRKCDKCSKDVVSMYSTNKPYPVWCYECWFADDWDATEYGQPYDAARPFIEQLHELYQKVPKVALIYVRSVNSEYVNISADNKDCYMLVESSNNEACIHSYWVQQCRDSVDLQFSHQTELSYDSDDCYSSYGLRYSKGCYDSRDSYFLLDCRGVSNCIGCVNLRNKQYCVFNEQLSKEGYEKFLAEAKLHAASGVDDIRKKFAEFLKTQPRKYAEITNAPGSSGNYITDAKNCVECFHCYDAEDSKYGEHVWRNAKDCMDVSTAGRNASRIYNSINTGIDVADHICCAQGWSSTFLEYSLNCFNANHCFGSAGIRKRDYCILNKQYTKEEYERLRGEIVAGMKAKEEYGEFFPATMSPFGYNETVAAEQFPLAKEAAMALGFSWEEHPRGTYGKETVQWANVSDSIRDMKNTDIAKEIFPCTSCTKNYRVIPAELQFYVRTDTPLPRLCPECRHARRMISRGPNKIFPPAQCQCDYKVFSNTAKHQHHLEGRCANTVRSSFPPGAPEILYCEQCYNAEVA